MYTAQYSIANNAAVTQTYTRVALSSNYAKYVNDTARAAGIEEWFELRTTENIPKKLPNNLSDLAGKWNLKVYTKGPTDTVPHITNWSSEMAKALSNAVVSARARYKDHRNVFLVLSDTDSEVDDITGIRSM